MSSTIDNLRRLIAENSWSETDKKTELQWLDTVEKKFKYVHEGITWDDTKEEKDVEITAQNILLSQGDSLIELLKQQVQAAEEAVDYAPVYILCPRPHTALVGFGSMTVIPRSAVDIGDVVQIKSLLAAYRMCIHYVLQRHEFVICCRQVKVEHGVVVIQDAKLREQVDAAKADDKQVAEWISVLLGVKDVIGRTTGKTLMGDALEPVKGASQESKQ